jgi:hypothetical protein
VPALLLISPSLLAAILFEPLSPFWDDPTTRLDEVGVLIIDGDEDIRRLCWASTPRTVSM